MKHIVKVFALMTFLIAAQQKAFSQTELKIHDGTVNPICKDSTKAPKDLPSFAIAVQDNTVVNFFQPGISNVDWANMVIEGFNYRAAARLGMEPITIGMLIKMLKDGEHCKIKYLNVKKGLLLNSGVDPATSTIVWVEMKNDITAEPYIVYTSPYNGQEAVLARWTCRCNPQADLREAIPEEKLADNNDDVYFNPKDEGITDAGDATATATATNGPITINNYIPSDGQNYQQYNSGCGCYQQMQQPCYNCGYYSVPQQYANYGQPFFGVTIAFQFTWGGQQYYAMPQDQVTQIVNNTYNNTYVYNTVNVYGDTTTTTTTDTGGATNGNDGDDGGVVDTGGATNGTDGGAQNGNDGGGRKSNPDANQNGYSVETLESNPIAHNASGLTLSNQGSDLSSAVGSSVHNAQTLDANPVLTNVSGIDHHVATLPGNSTPTFNSGNNPVTTLDAKPVALNTTGNPNYNGTNHIVTNLDPNPTLASNPTNSNVFDVNHSQNGQIGYQQSSNSNVLTASANNGTFNPQANYSQGVKTFSNGQQQYYQTNQTQPQGQWNGQYDHSATNGTNGLQVSSNGYQNYYNPTYNTGTPTTGTGNITTNGNLSSVPRGNISYVPQQNGNGQQYVQHVPQTNFALGNNGLMNYQPSRNLTFQQAPKFNLSQLGSKTFQSGRGAF